MIRDKQESGQSNDFDNFASEYNEIQRSSLGMLKSKRDILDIFAEYKIKETKRLIGISPKTILDFGCGIGRSLPYIAKYFPDAAVYGCDTSQESLNLAKVHHPDVKCFLSKEAGEDELDNFEKSFDLVIMICVMHHIASASRSGWLKRIARTLTSNGVFVTFEHNPVNPLTRHMVRKCVFDHDAELLRLSEYKSLLGEAGIQVRQQGYTLLSPWRNMIIESIEHLFSEIPLGTQYYLVGGCV